MVNAEINIQVGIGKHLFEELRDRGYSDTKMEIKVFHNGYGYADNIELKKLGKSKYKNLYAKARLPYYTYGLNKAHDCWRVEMCANINSASKRMKYYQYSSKHDLKGKLMVEHV